MKIPRDKQLHFFAMLSFLFTAYHFWAHEYIISLAGVVSGIIWEMRDLKLKRKDFGSRANEVKYDWGDIVPFAAAIGFFLLLQIIKNQLL